MKNLLSKQPFCLKILTSLMESYAPPPPSIENTQFLHENLDPPSDFPKISTPIKRGGSHYDIVSNSLSSILISVNKCCIKIITMTLQCEHQ